jgi:hypothetical protein
MKALYMAVRLRYPIHRAMPNAAAAVKRFSVWMVPGMFSPAKQ